MASGIEAENTPTPHLEAEPGGSGLDLRPVLRLAVRTLPYLRPILRELKPLLWVVIPLVLVSVPLGMLTTDLFLNRMMNGEPLTPFEARLLLLDPAQFVDVDALSISAREVLRDRLLISGFVFGISLAPVGLWAAYKFLFIRQRINQILRVEMMDSVRGLSLRYHSGTRVGDSIYRAFQDSAMVTNLMGMLVRPIGPLFAVVTGLLLAFLFDWRLPLLLLLLYLSTYLLALRATPFLRRAFRESRERNSALTSRIQETLTGMRVIKAYGAETIEQRRFEDASEAAFAVAFRARSRLALLGILGFTLSAIPSMLTATFVSVLARDAEPLAAGAALAIVGFATWNLGAYADVAGRVRGWTGAGRRLLWMWAQAQDMAVGMERAFTQIDLRPEVEDAPNAVPLPAFHESIEFSGVTFGYQADRPVLEDVDLVARAGTITALVGPTGSGKSTLASLLLRLFDPDQGRITIDGLDLRDVQIDSLRANVSIALQENLLFGTTIRENIRYAVTDATDDQVREAARIACAAEFIEAQPQGYDTPLGERGAKLSTGQRQRLSIARAVIKASPILILDEPTASLDAETELHVMRNLAEWGAGRAIFLVTHRLSTIRRADHIVYLREGRVVEAGSHEELMLLPEGAYRRFVELEHSGLQTPERAGPADTVPT